MSEEKERMICDFTSLSTQLVYISTNLNLLKLAGVSGGPSPNPVLNNWYSLLHCSSVLLFLGMMFFSFLTHVAVDQTCQAAR